MTKNVKRISGANVTNSFQAFCSVSDNARPLFFKDQNVYNQSFKIRYCLSVYHIYYYRTLKLPKNRGRKSRCSVTL